MSKRPKNRWPGRLSMLASLAGVVVLVCGGPRIVVTLLVLAGILLSAYSEFRGSGREESGKE